MPRKGGREAFEEMRRIHPRVKVIFMSGYAFDESDDTSGLGVDVPPLQKPFGPSKLARKIREVLDSGDPALSMRFPSPGRPERS
jgi:DNA-binding response OmpR family regulator